MQFCQPLKNIGNVRVIPAESTFEQFPALFKHSDSFSNQEPLPEILPEDADLKQ
jgi:hypothetical protein